MCQFLDHPVATDLRSRLVLGVLDDCGLESFSVITGSGYSLGWFANHRLRPVNGLIASTASTDPRGIVISVLDGDTVYYKELAIII